MLDGEWGEGEEIWGDCWITLPRKQENKNRPYCQSGEGTNNCLARLTRWKFTGQKSHQMKVYWMKVHQTKVSYDESLPDKKSRQTKIHWTKVSSDEGSPDKSLLDEGSPDKSSLQKWKGEQKLPNLHALGITTMPHVLNAPCTECPISNCSRHMTRGNSAYSAVFGWLKRGNSAYSVVFWWLKSLFRGGDGAEEEEGQGVNNWLLHDSLQLWVIHILVFTKQKIKKESQIPGHCLTDTDEVQTTAQLPVMMRLRGKNNNWHCIQMGVLPLSQLSSACMNKNRLKLTPYDPLWL